jgi:hypothetical protein
MLKKVFVTKRKEVTEDWRQPHYEKHYDSYFSPNIIQIIKSRGIRWEGYVPMYWLEERYIQGYGIENLEERDQFQDEGIDGRKYYKGF